MTIRKLDQVECLIECFNEAKKICADTGKSYLEQVSFHTAMLSQCREEVLALFQKKKPDTKDSTPYSVKIFSDKECKKLGQHSSQKKCGGSPSPTPDPSLAPSGALAGAKKSAEALGKKKVAEAIDPLPDAVQLGLGVGLQMFEQQDCQDENCEVPERFQKIIDPEN